ncbi:Integral membrane protein OS=Streptomyces microflavus OX=1919 GN=Smic_30800 PE=4 SV=1 [Streptomyces microflavus]
MVVERSVAAEKGDRFPVVVKPGSDVVVRTGMPGFLHAWTPLGGAMVLAGFVIGGGLRMTRTAWGVGTAGAVLLVATFVAL